MKKVWGYLKDFIKADFKPGLYLSVAIFLTICLVVNYYYDFEDSIIDSYTGKSIRILYYFLFYGFAFYSVSILTQAFNREEYYLKKRGFWIKSIVFLAIMAFDSAFHYHMQLLYGLPNEVFYTLQKILKNLTNIFTTLLPLGLFYWFFEKDKNRFYGLTLKNFDVKPYFTLLLIMLPIIIIASFIPNFGDFYPMYKPNNAHEYYGVESWVPAMWYELAYGWNFLTVELMFRGCLVIGLMSVMGRDCVLAMISVYCFYHFGKPEGEAISSIFGGYILGVIAFRTRSIFGGVIIHVGIAWMMEFFAYLQK